ncbi:MAG: BatA domain-containing protein [Verrucomicrobiia bacterium]
MNWPAFTNPLLLAGLAAVGLPLLVHWLTRARPRRIAFPPFKFLVEACAGQQTINRLRTILLLTIRCLLVLALAFLFARPFLKPTGAAVNLQATKRVVLVLDASLSMRAVQQGVPLFARAQAEAAEVLRALPSGTEAAVILEGATPRPLLPALSENLPALHDELVKAQPTFENGDPAAALALAKKLLGGEGTIYVFSDFQKSNWEEVRELPGGVVCRLRPVTTVAVDNVAITEARLIPAAPVMGEPVEVSCTVFNCTPRPREETVRLELAEFTRETHVALAPFGTANAVFNVTFSRAGSFAGKVSLAPDDLPEDNTRYLAANVSPTLEILLVSDADETDWRSAAFYVSRALVPSAQAAPGLKLVRRRGQDLDRGVLETADVFVLASPATLSGEAEEIITRRVNDGARLISFLDGPTSPALIFPALNPPFQLQRTVTSENGDSVSVSPRKFFEDLDAGDFSAPRFRRHYQNQLLENRAGDVLLSYPDGSAALTVSAAGNGAMVLANLPLTPDGGDFIGNPIFPAMLHELLRALRHDSSERAVTPGAAWLLDVPTTGEGAVTVTDPDGKKIDAQIVASGRTTRLALPAAKIPGIYSIKQADTVVSYAVVNVDPRESDTRPLAVENLKSGDNSAVTVLRGEEDLSLTGKTRELWPQLAAAAAALLGLEMLLLALWRSAKSIPPVAVEQEKEAAR